MADNNVQESLQALSHVDGFVSAAIAHGESGMPLGTIGGNEHFNIDIAVAANSEVVRAKLNTMKALHLDGTIEDILITLDTQYHLIRPLAENPVIFIYLAVERDKSNLALARFQLSSVEQNLKI